jgi:hypothetical protein
LESATRQRKPPVTTNNLAKIKPLCLSVMMTLDVALGKPLAGPDVAIETGQGIVGPTPSL